MNTLSTIAGLDMTVPGDITFGSGTSYFGDNLTTFVKNQTVSLARLDDMATRIVTARHYLHQDQDYPNITINSADIHDPISRNVNAQSGHMKVARRCGWWYCLVEERGRAAESMVLVGSDTAPPESGPNEYPDQGGDPTGVLARGWGSGTDRFRYLVSPHEAVQARARDDQTNFSWDFNNWDPTGAASVVVEQEVTIVFVNSNSGEGSDRQNLTAWHEDDQLIFLLRPPKMITPSSSQLASPDSSASMAFNAFASITIMCLGMSYALPVAIDYASVVFVVFTAISSVVRDQRPFPLRRTPGAIKQIGSSHALGVQAGMNALLKTYLQLRGIARRSGHF